MSTPEVSKTSMEGGKRTGESTFDPFIRRAAAVIGLLFGGAIVLLFLWTVAKVVLLVFAGILLAVIFSGFAKRLKRVLPLPYGAALAISILAIIVILGLIGWWITPQFVAQLDQITRTIPQSIDQIEQQIRQYSWGEYLLRRMPDSPGFMTSGGGLWGRITGYLSTIVEVVGGFIVVIAIGVFIAANPERYKRGIVALVPVVARERARNVLDSVGYALWDWLTAQFVAMLIVGVLTWIGLTILNVELALGLAVVNGLFEFVPIIGPWFGAIPGVLIALVMDSKQAIWVVLMYLAIQQLESNVITPIVLKTAAKLPAALTLTSTLIAGLLFGIIGVLLATPLMLVTVVLIQKLYVEDVLGDTDSSVFR